MWSKLEAVLTGYVLLAATLLLIFVDVMYAMNFRLSLLCVLVGLFVILPVNAMMVWLYHALYEYYKFNKKGKEL